MEGNFTRKQLDYLSAALKQVQNSEQTLEIKLPEGMPDVGQVLTAWGQPVMRSKEWLDSAVQFNGGMMGPAMNALNQVNYTLTSCVGAIIAFWSRAGKALPFSAIDVGGLAIFVNFSRQFSRPINELSHQLTTVMSALAGAERVFDVMDTSPEVE